MTEYVKGDRVRLVEDYDGLPKGTVGTVQRVSADPFYDDDGMTIVEVTWDGHGTHNGGVFKRRIEHVPSVPRFKVGDHVRVTRTHEYGQPGPWHCLVRGDVGTVVGVGSVYADGSWSLDVEVPARKQRQYISETSLGWIIGTLAAVEEIGGFRVGDKVRGTGRSAAQGEGKEGVVESLTTAGQYLWVKFDGVDCLYTKDVWPRHLTNLSVRHGLRIGDRVQHSAFGTGVVYALDDGDGIYRDDAFTVKRDDGSRGTGRDGHWVVPGAALAGGWSKIEDEPLAEWEKELLGTAEHDKEEVKMAVTFEVNGVTYADTDSAARLFDALKRAADDKEAFRRRLLVEQQSHAEDIRLIGETLISEANSRDWCSEYDDIVDDLNRKLTIELPQREKEYIVTFNAQFEVTVTARDKDSAVDQVKDDVTAYVTLGDGEVDSYSFDASEN